ncbi:MAG TPA: hypothetical protein VLM37_08955 [Fibrobacteraceae bacterium]|nr:hypothetical protein [Fibrobacteraceae bacterium]
MRILKQAFLLGILLWLVACNSQKVTLRFHALDPTELHFVLESQMKLIVDNGDSVDALGSNLQVLFHSTPVVNYDDGSARIQIQADSVSYRSTQRSVEECLHVERLLLQEGFQFKMAQDGMMQDIRTDGFFPDLERTDIDFQRLVLKVQPILPTGEVSLGDTWERQQLVGEGPENRAYVYKWFQLEDLYQREGKQLAKLRMNIKYRLDSATTGLRIRDPDFILGSGIILFNVTEGQLEEVSLEIDGSLNVLSPKIMDSLPTMQVRQVLHLWRSRP